MGLRRNLPRSVDDLIYINILQFFLVIHEDIDIVELINFRSLLSWVPKRVPAVYFIPRASILVRTVLALVGLLLKISLPLRWLWKRYDFVHWLLLTFNFLDFYFLWWPLSTLFSHIMFGLTLHELLIVKISATIVYFIAAIGLSLNITRFAQTFRFETFVFTLRRGIPLRLVRLHGIQSDFRTGIGRLKFMIRGLFGRNSSYWLRLSNFKLMRRDIFN